MSVESYSTFAADAPHGVKRTMGVFAIPESLTDHLATMLYGLAPVDGVSALDFIDALKQVSFIEPRNSEWSIEDAVRDHLLESGDAPTNLIDQTHRALLKCSLESDAKDAGYVIPNYLYTLGGRAYHFAGIGDVKNAIKFYGRAASAPYNGAQWLANRLANQQKRLGILPEDEVHLLFLNAITLFREGQREAARGLFERIVAKDLTSFTTAVALNILGNLFFKIDAARAENLLQRGIEMSERVGDEHGVAIGQHILGKLIGQNSERANDAEKLLMASIAYGDKSNNIKHSAIVRHSLGHFLSKTRDFSRSADAEEILRSAIRGLLSTGDRPGAGQAMHTLALLILRDKKRADEAEELLLQSIEIADISADNAGLAMRLNSLGRFLASQKDRMAESRTHLERARGIAVSLNNKRTVSEIDRFLKRLDS